MLSAARRRLRTARRRPAPTASAPGALPQRRHPAAARGRHVGARPDPRPPRPEPVRGARRLRSRPAGPPTPTLRRWAPSPTSPSCPSTSAPSGASGAVVGLVLWMLGWLQAMAGLVRLTRYVRRHRIDIIQSADRPRDAARLRARRPADAGPLDHPRPRRLRRVDEPAPEVGAAPRRRVWSASRRSWPARWWPAGTTASRVHAVRNGIDVDRVDAGRGRDEARAELGVARRRPRRPHDLPALPARRARARSSRPWKW